MAVGRRELMLGTLGMGLALAAGPRPARSEEGEIPQPFSTYGLAPGDGIDQTASLQEAADATVALALQAAESGTPFFLPPGNYMSGKLELKSGTQIQGVPGKSVLRCNGGGAVISIENASDIRLTGLTLEGEAKPIDSGALAVARRCLRCGRRAAHRRERKGPHFVGLPRHRQCRAWHCAAQGVRPHYRLRDWPNRRKRSVQPGRGRPRDRA